MEILIVRIDHMHNKEKYRGVIKKWVDEFELSGRLIFQGPVTLFIGQAGNAGVNDTILSRWNKEHVDEDAKGVVRKQCRSFCSKREPAPGY